MIFRFRLAVVWLVVMIVSNDTDAQYFGRNKVEYTDFDYRVLASEHFDVYYYLREERAARLAAQLAERWYARFGRILDHKFDRRQPLVVYGSQPEFAQTNVVSGVLSETVGGVTESAKRRIAMPFAPTLAETDRVLGHEIAHAFQFDIARREGGGLGLPLWFIEGMAEYLARGPMDAEASLWIRDAVLSAPLPGRARDAARRLSPYHYGHAFWSYLAARFGDQVLIKALKPGKRGKLDDRIRHATGLDLDTLFADWRASVVSTYDTETRSTTDALVRRWTTGAFGRVQLGPAVSPDGRQAVFFSERDRLSLDLFLADITTGRIIRKLATTTASARFDSLQPLRSAGAWSPDGRSFAFAAVRQGHASLVLLDMDRTGREQEIPFPRLGQILSLTWAPDGQTLAFSALAGGFTDLYIYDLGRNQLKQLTDDAFADLHPAWSPDGSAIAFATERYSSDLAALQFGRLQLATIDVGSGRLSSLALAPSIAHVNPQWSADSRQLYFVANPGEASNVFKLDLDAHATSQITAVGTGVTGLTPTSLTMSLAGRAPVLAFTILENGRHQLAVLEGARALEGASVAEPAMPSVAASQPAEPDLVAATLIDSYSGLPDPATIVTREYSPRLSLERVGQPYVSSGSGPFGTFVRGGGSLLFGDLLGERRFGAAVQIGNRLRDAAFEARYLNQEHRWNWGVVAELEPAFRRYRRTETIDQEGQPALLKQFDDLQRVQLAAAGLLAYPFNRGLRVELIGGVRHSSYRRDRRSQLFSSETGRLLQEDHWPTLNGAPTTMAEFGGALVGDTTVFGPTGPIVGSRYRVEVSPAIGDLTYTRVLADYRRYVMPVRPYSVAMRVLHSGRYGHDGDDPRLLSTFLGSRYFVRGHGLDLRHCQPTPDRGCGDELLGNRLLVTNLELRFPIWGAFSRQLEYGSLPADGFVFADGGFVWSPRSEEVPGRRRTMISSVGIGARINAGGLPFEFVAVRALDGPRPGWTFDYGFRLGF